MIFSGITWWMIELQNYKLEIAKNFEPAPKDGKTTVCISFSSGIYKLDAT